MTLHCAQIKNINGDGMDGSACRGSGRRMSKWGEGFNRLDIYIWHGDRILTCRQISALENSWIVEIMNCTVKVILILGEPLHLNGRKLMYMQINLKTKITGFLPCITPNIYTFFEWKVSNFPPLNIYMRSLSNFFQPKRGHQSIK